MPTYVPMPSPPSELSDTPTADLIAQKQSYEKANTYSYVASWISIPGMFFSGITAFYEFSAYLIDKTIYNAPRETLNTDLKGFGSSGATTVGFFGIYKYAKYKIQKNQEQIDRLNLELTRRELEANVFRAYSTL